MLPDRRGTARAESRMDESGLRAPGQRRTPLHFIHFPLALAHSCRVTRTLFWTTSGSFDRSRFAPSNQPVGSAKMMCCSTNSAPVGSASLVIFR